LNLGISFGYFENDQYSPKEEGSSDNRHKVEREGKEVSNDAVLLFSVVITGCLMDGKMDIRC
jgi:hypothetical protein